MSSSDNTAALSVIDYLVFVVLLAVSTAVGVFFAYRDRRKKNSENYLLGNRKISWWASGISCTLSFFAGSTVIGIPAEIMYRGSTYSWFLLGILISHGISCEMFLPIYYKNGMSSANEYFGKRFGKYARLLATIIYLLQTISYTGVMIYAPALAFNAVSDLSLIAAVLSIGIVCTIYTTLGGLKAVIWTDVLQSIVVLVVLVVTLFVSAGKVGGLSQCLSIAWKGDRIDFNHFEFDPRYRMTFWSAVFGLGIMWASVGSTNQAVVQRFLCCRSIKEGKMAVYSTIPLSLFQTTFLLTFTGYVLYAYFSTCDPLLNGDVSAPDQVLPLMVLRVFSDTPGVSGLFIAGVFAGALSTISSAINGMTCVTVGDIIRPVTNWSDHTFLWISRMLTFVFGALCIGFAFMAPVLGNVVQATLSLLGVCAGALLGPVVIGALFPLANEKGAIAGMVSALAFNIWLFVGAWMYPPPVEFLNLKDLSVAGCEKVVNTDAGLNMSTIATTSPMPTLNEFAMPLSILDHTATTSSPPVDERPAIAEFYAVSFAYYAPMGTMVCVIVGIIVSVLTGGMRSRYYVDPELICLPFEHPLLRWLPRSFREHMVPKMGEGKKKPDDIKSSEVDIPFLKNQTYGVSSFTKDTLEVENDDTWNNNT